METVIRRCAGPDVHKVPVVACVRLIDENGELLSFTQSFGTIGMGPVMTRVVTVGLRG
ncbi:MAG: hypothetical protein ACYC8W_12150 [Candidatus Tyrphobacter sp.]